MSLYAGGILCMDVGLSYPDVQQRDPRRITKEDELGAVHA